MILYAWPITDGNDTMTVVERVCRQTLVKSLTLLTELRVADVLLEVGMVGRVPPPAREM